MSYNKNDKVYLENKSSMKSQSEIKKDYILTKAKEVFIKKGYKTVTMTDIVDACEISGGELDRYYKSTAEILFEVLQMEQAPPGDVFSKEMKSKISTVTILDSFFEEQKNDILLKKESLTLTIYEFLSTHRVDFEEDIMNHQFETAVTIVSELVEDIPINV